MIPTNLQFWKPINKKARLEDHSRFKFQFLNRKHFPLWHPQCSESMDGVMKWNEVLCEPDTHVEFHRSIFNHCWDIRPRSSIFDRKCTFSTLAPTVSEIYGWCNGMKWSTMWARYTCRIPSLYLQPLLRYSTSKFNILLKMHIFHSGNHSFRNPWLVFS